MFKYKMTEFLYALSEEWNQTDAQTGLFKDPCPVRTSGGCTKLHSPFIGTVSIFSHLNELFTQTRIEIFPL